MAKHKHRDAIQLKPHHRKPYRIHHLGFFLASLLLVILIAIELGMVIGHNQRPVAPKPSQNTAANRFTEITSPYGFKLRVDGSQFVVSSSSDTSVVIRPKAGSVSGNDAATRLTIAVNSDKSSFAQAIQAPDNKGLSGGQVAKQLFPVAASSRLDMQEISKLPDNLNGAPVFKTVYKYSDKAGGGSSYGVVWTGEVAGRAFAVKLDGLVGSPNIPPDFLNLISSLQISSAQAVLGASTNIFASQTASFNGRLDYKYLSDAVSPAVVQIFHTVCGVLTYGGQALGGSSCISMSGSGFLATQDGYIATNGHVVIYDAKDALANLVTSNDSVLQAYLGLNGYSPSQIAAIKADVPSLAAIISKIYDLPASQLNFANKGEALLVSLGKNQPDLKALAALTSSDQLAQLRHDTDSIKQAKIIGYNYSAKDKYIALANPAQGYSSSDVALLKINVHNAPTIPIETAPVVQNQRIVLMGFPGDASNPLIDNTYNDVTVTDGVVSAIRQAAGGRTQLYQSDVDASHGNSGGPAIDDQGKAIGLLTYRYVDSTSGNSAKSYIRDIADFSELAKNEAVTINSTSRTQTLWLSGLQNFSKNHYSAALRDFNQVYAAYPSHRLVGSYIYSSKKAITDGQDVKDLPIRYLELALVLSIVALGVTTYVIVRHHGMHKVYQVSQRDENGHQRAVILAHEHQGDNNIK